MKRAFLALKGGDWEEYNGILGVQAKSTEWAFGRLQEAFEKVAKDEARKLSTVQEVMLRSTNCLRRIIAPTGGHGGVTMSYLCPHCKQVSCGRLRLAGLSGDKAHQLVVCDPWRKI